MRTRAWRRVQRKRIQRRAYRNFPWHDREWLTKVAEHFTPRSYYQDTRAYLGPTRQEWAAALRFKEQISEIHEPPNPLDDWNEDPYEAQYWEDVRNGLFDEYDFYDQFDDIGPFNEHDPRIDEYDPYNDPNYGYDPYPDFGTWDFSPKRNGIDFFYYGGICYDAPRPAGLDRPESDKSRRWWDFVYAPPGYLSTEDYYQHTNSDFPEDYDPYFPDPTPNHPESPYRW